jgi:hypothetical protein
MDLACSNSATPFVDAQDASLAPGRTRERPRLIGGKGTLRLWKTRTGPSARKCWGIDTKATFKHHAIAEKKVYRHYLTRDE